MSKHIEQHLRATNPSEMVGLNMQKVNDAIGFLTHRVGQRGKSRSTFSLLIPQVYLSVQELHHLAQKLKCHSLQILDYEASELWRYSHCSENYKKYPKIMQHASQ